MSPAMAKYLQKRERYGKVVKDLKQMEAERNQLEQELLNCGRKAAKEIGGYFVMPNVQVDCGGGLVPLVATMEDL